MIIINQEKVKAIALRNINLDLEKEVAKLTQDVPETEKATWTKQEQEARAYKVDNTTPTPCIDYLVASRGVDKDTLVDKIIYKADIYSQALFTLIGKKQKAEDELQQ